MFSQSIRPVGSLFLGVVIALGVGETLLAHSNLIDNPPGQFRRSLTRAFEHKPGFKGKDQFGNPIWINSHGMRDREFELAKPKNTYRILVLGDSVTFGWGVKFEDTYAKQLEALLNQEHSLGRRVEVLNAGIRGYNTYQELQLLREVGMAFEPDLVVLTYVNNDAEPLKNQDGLIDKKHEWLIRVKDFVKERSYLYAFFRKNLEVMRHRVTPETFSESYNDQFDDEHPGWKVSKDSLAQIQQMSKEKGFRFLLAIYPQLEGLKSGETYPEPYQKIRDQLKKTAEEFGIDTLDLLDWLKGTDPEKLKILPRDGFHPNPYGHKRVAEAIGQTVLTKYLQTP